MRCWGGIHLSDQGYEKSRPRKYGEYPLEEVDNSGTVRERLRALARPSIPPFWSYSEEEADKLSREPGAPSLTVNEIKAELPGTVTTGTTDHNGNRPWYAQTDAYTYKGLDRRRPQRYHGATERGALLNLLLGHRALQKNIADWEEAQL